jgi:hypothetical protein
MRRRAAASAGAKRPTNAGPSSALRGLLGQHHVSASSGTRHSPWTPRIASTPKPLARARRATLDWRVSSSGSVFGL